MKDLSSFQQIIHFTQIIPHLSTFIEGEGGGGGGGGGGGQRFLSRGLPLTYLPLINMIYKDTDE